MSSRETNEQLPVHFFTIVLNGEPFIRYHLEALAGLPFRWHWHIVEGVARLRHDTAWSVSNGGRISDSLHSQGRSHDGTSEYLDRIQREHPDKITIYRKPPPRLWDGKLEMINAFLPHLPEDCLLWQVDADELWSRAQIVKLRELFLEHPGKTAAWFWCRYFVGPELVVSSRAGYSQNPESEWLRVWRYKSGMEWASHEPPRLIETSSRDGEREVGKINPFWHFEMEEHGLVFQHFAYAVQEQLAFKQIYYGYRDALDGWQKLQAAQERPLLLRNYFSWVKDDTAVDSTTALGVVPIAVPGADGWRFRPQEKIASVRRQTLDASPRIIIDGVFFQMAQSGIARVWRSLLEQWAKTDFASHILVLDRNHTAPRFRQLRYLDVPKFNERDIRKDGTMLQSICNIEGADLFISTYNTTPLHTPTAYLVHDMIPEILKIDFDPRPWLEKTFALLNARRIIAISENTARDIHQVHAHIPKEQIRVIYPGCSPVFHRRNSGEIDAFRRQHGIARPYFLVVGLRTSYKNIEFFFRAFSLLVGREKLSIVCAGGAPELEKPLRKLAGPATVHRIDLTDDELATAYSGALALVYPSRYEGFGLPVLEAMACGCPALAAPVSSLPEVAGDAALYFSLAEVNSLVQALTDVQSDAVRKPLIEAGLRRASLFSWQKMADEMQKELFELASSSRDGRLAEPSPLLRETREMLLKAYGYYDAKISGNDSHPSKKERSIKMKVWRKYRLKISLYQ